jgi:hypothetical protein
VEVTSLLCFDCPAKFSQTAEFFFGRWDFYSHDWLTLAGLLSTGVIPLSPHSSGRKCYIPSDTLGPYGMCQARLTRHCVGEGQRCNFGDK